MGVQHVSVLLFDKGYDHFILAWNEELVEEDQLVICNLKIWDSYKLLKVV